MAEDISIDVVYHPEYHGRWLENYVVLRVVEDPFSNLCAILMNDQFHLFIRIIVMQRLHNRVPLSLLLIGESKLPDLYKRDPSSCLFKPLYAPKCADSIS